MWYTPPVHRTLRYPEVLKPRRDHLRKFLALWDKFPLTEIYDIPPLMHKFFWCSKVPGTPMGSPVFYFASVRQKISTNHRDIPLLWIKIFDRTEISQTQKRFPDKNSQHCESKKFNRELCYTPNVHKTLWNSEIVKHSRVPLWIFSTLWDKFPSTENHDIAPLMHKFSWFPKLPGKPMGSSDICFSSVRQKKFDKITLHTPLMDKSFWYVRN